MHSDKILQLFACANNKKHLYSVLSERFNNDDVNDYLRKNFANLLETFLATMREELYNSDPLPGTTQREELEYYNNQFIESKCQFLLIHVVGETTPRYSIADAHTRGKVVQRSAAETLERWRKAPSRSEQCREDPSDRRQYTGVALDFCDQKNVGLQRHLDLFDPASNPLNASRPHEAYSFGTANAATDARLLSRSVFRRNESGVENGISRRESRLYARSLDTDVDESVIGQERGYSLRAHDMGDLVRSVDRRQASQIRL
jgi:hypothetical protein